MAFKKILLVGLLMIVSTSIFAEAVYAYRAYPRLTDQESSEYYNVDYIQVLDITEEELKAQGMSELHFDPYLLHEALVRGIENKIKENGVDVRVLKSGSREGGHSILYVKPVFSLSADTKSLVLNLETSRDGFDYAKEKTTTGYSAEMLHTTAEFLTRMAPDMLSNNVKRSKENAHSETPQKIQ